MRKLAIFGWLLVPVIAGAYHYGPGQDRLLLDDATALLDTADELVKNGRYDKAVDAYDQALGKLPVGHLAEARRIRLERAKALMLDRKLPEADADLKAIVDELQKDDSSDKKLLADARSALAGSQYYMTWLMKLEGLGREEWGPEIESSRQLYKMLAEEADANGEDATSKERREDVESAIRLARMDPGELQGKAIPKPCQGCKSGQCKKPGRKPSQSKNQAKDARGASSGPPPDGSGS